LKPGGTLLVGDLLHEDGSDHVFPDGVEHIVAHSGGLTESAMKDAFGQAGLREFSFEVVGSGKKFGWQVKFFVAKCVKAL
jgi:hypothetical protein